MSDYTPVLINVFEDWIEEFVVAFLFRSHDCGGMC